MQSVRTSFEVSARSLGLLALAALLPCTAAAQVDPTASLNVHVTPQSATACPGADLIDRGRCTDLDPNDTGGPAFAWVVLSRQFGFPDGVGGVQFGLLHGGFSEEGWVLCTGGSQAVGGQNPPGNAWPTSGTGAAITWAAGCYRPDGDNAVIGYLVVDHSGNGFFDLTADPRAGAPNDVQYTTCAPDPVTFEVVARGGADWPSTSADPTCPGATPSHETSWGRIKSLF